VTSENWFELIKDILIALPTIVFTGWIAFWTWLRDQDRLKVQKYLVFANTIEGDPVLVRDTDVGVMVVNLSLFPVRICAVGFTTPEKGSFIELRDTRIEVAKEEAFAPMPFPTLERVEVRWPVEIPSHGKQLFFAGAGDLKRLASVPLQFWNTAACKAIAVTEARPLQPFYSKRSWRWKLRDAITRLKNRGRASVAKSR